MRRSCGLSGSHNRFEYNHDLSQSRLPRDRQPYQNRIKTSSETAIRVILRAKSRFPELLKRLNKPRNGQLEEPCRLPPGRKASGSSPLGRIRPPSRFNDLGPGSPIRAVCRNVEGIKTAGLLRWLLGSASLKREWETGFSRSPEPLVRRGKVRIRFEFRTGRPVRLCLHDRHHCRR